MCKVANWVRIHHVPAGGCHHIKTWGSFLGGGGGAAGQHNNNHSDSYFSVCLDTTGRGLCNRQPRNRGSSEWVFWIHTRASNGIGDIN